MILLLIPSKRFFFIFFFYFCFFLYFFLFYLVNRRLQSGNYKYTGVVNAFTTIMKEEGVGALLKGTLPRILIIAPLFAITFTCFELFQRIFLPNTEAPLTNLQEDLTLIRGERFSKISERMKKDWGIKL